MLVRVMTMKKKSWMAYLAFILLAEAVGVLAGLLTRNGLAVYETVPKSALTPPAAVFPAVWTILYALMGVGAARVYLAESSLPRTRSLGLFAFQLIVNFFWSLFFFHLRAYGFSLLWLLILWALILAMILSYEKVDRPAALLQIPYLLWVTFAAYLNFAVWMMNRS
jgi:benzodiazapine receptor